MAYRGVFMEDKWGTDLMTLDDWKGFVDYLADRKMNVLGVGLYGCWCVQYDGAVTEFLLTPVPGHPELRKEWVCRWYSTREGQWKERRYLPLMYEQDFFGDLVAYGRERGVHVVPFVNSLGHNTLFPRKLPEISSKDENGNPKGYGYCLSNPETWEFVSGFYGDIVDRCLRPHGATIFHVQLDEVGPGRGMHPSDPKRVVDPECQCPECSRRPFGERIQDYVIRLTKFLVSRGMEHVVIWNDQLTRHMDLVDDAFIARLKREGIFENLVLHWWWYDPSSIHEKVHPHIGRGLRGWVGPMTCYFNWSHYRENHRNIASMLAMGHAENAEGAVSYSVYDAANDYDFTLLSEYAWDERGPGPLRAGLDKFAHMTAGPHAPQLAEAIRAMDTCGEQTPINVIIYYTYSYPAADQPYPRRYPLEALDTLADLSQWNMEGRSSLTKVRSWSRRARRLLERIPAEHSGETVRNLIAEAARYEALSGAFLELMRIRQACAELADLQGSNVNPPAEARTVALRNSRHLAEWFSIMMGLVEANKPDYMVPSCLRDLSVMVEFLLQLRSDVTEADQGARAWSEVRWFVEPCIAQRGL